MCGIVGWILEPELTNTPGLLESAADALAHRGPDGSGTWRSPDGRVAFGHRRLSVIDTSAAGDQPMRSAEGRFTIVFNGEIYNHRELRERLSREGAAPDEGWRGSSDTETLLAALRAWGAERTLQATRGMFAFALWDAAEQRLTLARDRLGEKPLYVSRLRHGIAFASELKALRRLPGFDTEIDRGALDFYLRHAYVRAPSSIYRATTKLLPGTYVSLSPSDIERLGRDGDFLQDARRHYWSLVDVALAGCRAPFEGSEAEAVDELERHLRTAVERQMISDVPLGAFLSGGIDSTAVVALMQAVAGGGVKTFTIGFDDERFDESPYAAEVARHLGTDHTAVTFSADDALERVREVPAIWDEPFADPSQLPTLLVSEVARSRVTVALSGDGGDELFGGYERYGLTERSWSRLGAVPAPVRGVVATGVRAVPTGAWDGLLRVLPERLRTRFTGDRLHKLAGVLPASGLFDYYDGFLSSWKAPGSLLLGDAPPPAPHWAGQRELGSIAESLMLHDALDYMPDDVLVKVDRATMSRSLETRAPLLDADVVELAWRLPLAHKRRDGVGKRVLRQLVHRYVPEALVERPKTGFGVPMSAWLRGPLRDWAGSLLEERSLTEAGLAATPVLGAWRAHQAGTEDHQYFLWNVVTYLAWRQQRP